LHGRFFRAVHQGWHHLVGQVLISMLLTGGYGHGSF
jgi:hypothetical protein